MATPRKTSKKKTPAKKPTKKTGLGRVPVCKRKEINGSTTIYTSHGDSNPCPYGGSLNGAKKTPKKRISAKRLCSKVIKVPGINSRTGQLLKGWHYVGGKPVKVTKKPVAKKKPAAKKPGLKKPIKKHEGINQTTGRLKKGWRYGANGRIVKAKAKK